MNFRSYLSELSIEATEETLNKFELYYQMLVDWNSRINLTAITDHDEVYLKHFYDSLLMTKVVNLNEVSNLCDIGSGAGFPAIPLKLVFPKIDILIIEPTQKRTMFLNEVVASLALDHIVIRNERAEDIASEYRESFDIVTARAVAKMDVLMELCFSYVRPGGCFIGFKGINIEEEIAEAGKAINILGGKLEDIYKTELPQGAGGRSLLKIVKISRTPDEYPRAFAKIKNRPLSVGGIHYGKSNSHR
jgi:16S rRNA (guanine527-N7)-methyltransferase